MAENNPTAREGTNVPPAASKPSRAYDAFISYSRKDRDFAARLHRALDHYTPPAGLVAEARRLRVFRDESDLTGVDYFDAIQRHLAEARKLIVICSPDAATSKYVDDEIERFVQLHGPGAVVPVLWRGLPNNEAGEERAGERAFPPALCRAMEMPLAVDYRRFDPRRDRADGAEHQTAWMGLLANLLDRPRAEVEQREMRRRRQRRQLWAAGIGSVIVALLALSAWALIEGERALARQLAAQAALPSGLDIGQVERRVLIAREAARRLERLGEPTLAADTPLREALAQTPRRLLALPPGVRRVAFAADGEHLLVAEGDRLRVLALDGGTLRREVPLPRPLLQLAAGADLRFLAGLDDQGGVMLWAWPSLRALEPVPAEVAASPVHCLAFDPDGDTLVALRLGERPAPSAMLMRWRPGEPELVERAEITLPANAGPPADRSDCLAAGRSSSNDAAMLAVLAITPDKPDTDPARLVLHWPLKSLAWTFGATSPGASIGLHAGVRFGALNSGAAVLLENDGNIFRPGRDGGIRVRAVPDRTQPQALAPNGRWLVAAQGLEDPYVPLLKSTRFDIVDTGSGAVVQSVGDHGARALFTPDGQRLLTYGDRRARLWDRRDGAEVLRLFARGPITSVRFDPASRHLAAILADGALEVFRISGADEVGAIDPAVEVAPLGGSGRLAVASRTRLLIDPVSRSGLPAELELGRHVDSMMASPDGRWLALGVTPERRLIRLGPPADAELWLVQTDPESAVRYRGPRAQHLRFDRSSTRLVTVSESGQVRALDLARPESPAWRREVKVGDRKAYHGPGDPRHALAMSDDGSVVAVFGQGGVALLAGQSGEPLRRDGEGSGVLALSADGRLLARTAGDKTIRVELSADGGLVAELDRSGVSVRDLMFSPGAKKLMALGGTSFGTFVGTRHYSEEHLMVWDLDSGQAVQRIPEVRKAKAQIAEGVRPEDDERAQVSSLVWNAHTREVAAVVFPSMLAYWTVPAGNVRSQIVAWRLTDHGLVEVFRTENSAQLDTVALGAEGGVLVTKSVDGFSRFIGLYSDRLAALACRWVNRSLTDAERETYLGSSFRRPFACPPQSR